MLFVLARRRQSAERLIEWATARLPEGARWGIRGLAKSLLDGLGAVGHGPSLAVVVLYSTVLWGFIISTYLFSFLALDLEVPLVSASLAAVVIVAFFVFLPQAPGYIGTWQAGCVLALSLYGVSREEAVGFSFLTWLIQMVVNIGAAAVCAAFEDLSGIFPGKGGHVAA